MRLNSSSGLGVSSLHVLPALQGCSSGSSFSSHREGVSVRMCVACDWLAASSGHTPPTDSCTPVVLMSINASDNALPMGNASLISSSEIADSTCCYLPTS